MIFLMPASAVSVRLILYFKSGPPGAALLNHRKCPLLLRCAHLSHHHQLLPKSQVIQCVTSCFDILHKKEIPITTEQSTNRAGEKSKNYLTEYLNFNDFLNDYSNKSFDVSISHDGDYVISTVISF